MINTIYGQQDESNLNKVEGVIDNETEYTTWTEYRNASGEVVHRSAHVTVKVGTVSGAAVGEI